MYENAQVRKPRCNVTERMELNFPLLLLTPGEENGYPFQYSCLENPMERGTWWATVYGVAKSWTQLSD